MNWKAVLHWFGRALILGVFLGAAWLLYARLKRYSPEEIWGAVCGTSPGDFLVAAVLTAFNYVILVGYDLLAIRWVGEKLPLWKISLASFTGYAFSYNFGATVFGTSIRYRLYSLWGVPLMKILELLVILGLTFWFGLFALAGLVFVCTPLDIPRTILEAHPGFWFHDTYWLGWLLLAIAVAYVAASAMHRGSLKLWRWTIPVPPFKLTLYQIGIASADLLVAAAVLYALMPHIENVDYLHILGVFMLAFTASVITHVPGGYGVFEATVLEVLDLPKEQELAVLAAILVFRLVYYWLPLLVAAIMLGTHELAVRQTSVPQAGERPAD